MPVGTIQYFAGNTPPEDWLLCDGNTISRTEYEELFSIIGTTYGTGDGSTTFQLPNLIGRFVEGAATVGMKKDAGLPNITGEIEAHWRSDISSSSGAFARKLSNNKRYVLASALGTEAGMRILLDASLASNVYGKSTTVQPASITLLPIIKAR